MNTAWMSRSPTRPGFDNKKEAKKQVKKIVIYGAAVFDVVKLIESVNRATPTWEMLGFLDDTPGLKGQYISGYRVFGGRELIPEFVSQADTYFFSNVNGTRPNCQHVVNLLISHHCKIPTLVHPAIDLNYVRIGSGCIVPEGAFSALMLPSAIMSPCGMASPSAMM